MSAAFQRQGPRALPRSEGGPGSAVSRLWHRLRGPRVAVNDTRKGTDKMTSREGYAGRCGLMAASAMFAIVLMLGELEARAEDTPQAPAPAAPAAAAVEVAPAVDPEEPSAPSAGALSPEELQALVAPVALYPDLVLVLTLQASLAPLDIVQAARFLER
jgi:Protein of unknown function (DUF3300)